MSYGVTGGGGKLRCIMVSNSVMIRKLAVVMLVAGVIGAATKPPPVAAAGPPSSLCLACHGNASFSSKLGDGEKLSLFVDGKVFAHSVHGGKLACTDCHSDITAVPHAVRHFPNRRAVQSAYYELCKRCHFSEYSRLLDGVHYAETAKGNQNAPT